MSYKEAVEDGIKRQYSDFGQCHYLVPCSVCKNLIKKGSYDRNKIYVCNDCNSKSNTEFTKKRQNNMLNRAIALLKKMLRKSSEEEKKYFDAITMIRESINNGVIYDSKEEILVAIELEKNDIKYELHKKINGYTIDFYLPYRKMNIEVDGVIFHRNNVNKDLKRDIEFEDFLDIKVVRILDISIDYNVIGLMDIIDTVESNGEMTGNYIDDDTYFLYSIQA